MPKVEDYKVWQKAVALASDVIAWTIHTATIEKQYGIKDQLQRSALSVPSNIAEGVDRETDKELARYVYIAR
ncbi:MAG: four helix bundle protein [Candidatus Peribacteria bacterium]|nr:MAG: four helix bundle protein [Candidatus Peribacteria bacterium]